MIANGPLTLMSLSDIDHSTAANDGQASTLFSAPKNPQRIPANTPPVFRGLRPRICLPLLRLVPSGNVGQAPSQCQEQRREGERCKLKSAAKSSIRLSAPGFRDRQGKTELTTSPLSSFHISVGQLLTSAVTFGCRRRNDAETSSDSVDSYPGPSRV